MVYEKGGLGRWLGSTDQFLLIPTLLLQDEKGYIYCIHFDQAVIILWSTT
jgi:hypothetical protein